MPKVIKPEEARPLDLDNLPKLSIWCRLTTPFRRTWSFISDIPRNINYFFQRGIRGYSDCDLWNFNSYLNKVILEGLVWLRANKHGYPATPDPAKNNEYDYNEERWNIILDEMIQGFAIMNKCLSSGELEYMPSISDEDRDKINKEWKEKKYDMQIASKEEEEKMQKALQLFAKHIWSLWD
jgi:hypothetical protein